MAKKVGSHLSMEAIFTLQKNVSFFKKSSPTSVKNTNAMVLPQTVSKALKCSGPDLPNRSFKGNGYPTVHHTVLFCSFFNSNIPQGLWWNASFEKASRSSACSPVPCGSHGAGAFSGACWVLLSSDFLLAQSCWPLPAPVPYQSLVGFVFIKHDCLQLLLSSTLPLCKAEPLAPAAGGRNLILVGGFLFVAWEHQDPPESRRISLFFLFI